MYAFVYKSMYVAYVIWKRMLIVDRIRRRRLVTMPSCMVLVVITSLGRAPSPEMTSHRILVRQVNRTVTGRSCLLARLSAGAFASTIRRLGTEIT